MPVEYELKRADTIGRTVVEEVGWNTKQEDKKRPKIYMCICFN